MDEKIKCKIISPFKVNKVLFDKIGEIYEATYNQYLKFTKAKCLVKIQENKYESKKEKKQK